MTNQVQPSDDSSIQGKVTPVEDPAGVSGMPQDAIVVRYAHKRYGKSSPPVLDGLNMVVPRGCIYGLLGASGCGKTTLLSCVVGVRKLDSGEIWVLGGKPGMKDSGIPGPRVGYMPQEISLVNEFSVIGALYYFGRINGLEDSVIDERFGFFSELLQLPPKNRLIKHCSGGQQRRVSFAASLIHKPELLILDEPTVGLDPILRENIWNFLVTLAKEEGTAVVITTHYIEEAKQAHKIGLMRHGQLLAETSPQALLLRFQCSNLEEAFLILSQKQKDSQDKGILEIASEVPDLTSDVTGHSNATSQTDLRSSTDCIMSSEKHLLASQFANKKQPLQLYSPISGKIFKALMTKNFLQFLRHPGTILFAFVFPIVQVTLFFSAIGKDPRDIKMAIVNDEAGNCDFGRNIGSVVYNRDLETCDYVDVSCRFLHGFDDVLMDKRYYDTMDEARQAVAEGKAAGTVYFPRNFSAALQYRRDTFATDLTKEDAYYGTIHTALDMGDRQIGLFMQKGMLERFLEIHGDIVSLCNVSRKFTDLPLRLEEPIYGSLDFKYSDSVAPGFMLTVCFFLATAVSSSIIIADRAEGVWDRSLVQGVKTSEILLSHILTQLTMILIQVAVVLSITFGLFNLDCKGSFLGVIAMAYLTGFCGMCYGFVISTWCPSHTLANFLSTGSFYPLVLLGGSIWPAEGMPKFLRGISYTLPTTVPGFSLNNILNKGYPFHYTEVWSGFAIIFGWSMIFILICLYGLKSRY